MRIVTIHLAPEAADAELEFRYDPEIVDVIRGVRQRRWHAQRRRWTVARVEVDGLCAELEQLGVRVQLTQPLRTRFLATHVLGDASPAAALPSPKQEQSEPLDAC